MWPSQSHRLEKTAALTPNSVHFVVILESFAQADSARPEAVWELVVRTPCTQDSPCCDLCNLCNLCRATWDRGTRTASWCLRSCTALCPSRWLAVKQVKKVPSQWRAAPSLQSPLTQCVSCDAVLVWQDDLFKPATTTTTSFWRARGMSHGAHRANFTCRSATDVGNGYHASYVGAMGQRRRGGECGERGTKQGPEQRQAETESQRGERERERELTTS